VVRNEKNMEVRERILEKAGALFMQYGIRSITMDEIAAQLGISKKTIYQFFTDKDEMVEAVVMEEINRNEGECHRFRVASENAVHEIFMAMDDMEEIIKSMNPQVMYDLEKHHPAAFKRLKQHKYQFLLTMTRENIARGIREDMYRPDINIDLIARHRIESSFMAFNQELFPAGKYSISSTCYELALLFLHSIANGKGKKLIEKYLIERQKTIAS
jgi:TetR/AcrR family transcriptional regulator, cholesterol catabolism regulator